jgi:type III pantothenate kinase
MKIKDNEIAAIDIGNSRIKIKTDSNLYIIDHKSSEWQIYLSNFITEHKTIKYFAVSSVVSNIKSLVLNILKENGIKNIYHDNDLLSMQRSVKYNHIKGIGYDRVFGLIGAMDHFKAPLMTIDCGTAITVNVVDSKGIVLGGAIFAGLHTQLRSLAENTDQLMEIDLSKDAAAIGKNTEDAIRSGIIIGTAGAINEFIKLIRYDIFSYYKVNIIITGGSAELLLPHLDQSENRITLHKHLVLDGILAALSYSFSSLVP